MVYLPVSSCLLARPSSGISGSTKHALVFTSSTTAGVRISRGTGLTYVRPSFAGTEAVCRDADVLDVELGMYIAYRTRRSRRCDERRLEATGLVRKCENKGLEAYI